eukprot:s977_g16.t2
MRMVAMPAMLESDALESAVFKCTRRLFAVWCNAHSIQSDHVQAEGHAAPNTAKPYLHFWFCMLCVGRFAPEAGNLAPKKRSCSRWMGTVCTSPVEDDATSNGQAPWTGVDAEPLWKQVADEQIARKKSIKESWPEVEKELTARAFALGLQLSEVMEKKKKKAKPKPKPKLDAPASPVSPASPSSPASPASPASRASPVYPAAAAPAPAPEGQARPKMVKLSKAQAKEALRKAVAIFEKPQNKKKLKEVVASCGEDGAQRIATLMHLGGPVVKGLLADLLESYDFPRDKLLCVRGYFIRLNLDQMISPDDSMARQQLVEVDNELFLWSEESEAEDDRDEAAALQRKMFNIQYLSRHRWKTPSKFDVKASRLDSNQRISAKEVLEALRRIPNKHWKNNGRANVRPDGVEYIDSITLGLVSCASTLGRPLPSKATHSYKNLTRMLLRFFKQNIEEHERRGYGCTGMVCTSIQLNRNYAAREHVDGNNVGPSWIIGLGDWTAGGQLFVEDPEGRERHVLTCDIPGRYREGDTCYGTSLDVHNRWARFDGRRMHFVRPFFGGDRFSLVFFATTRHAGGPFGELGSACLLISHSVAMLKLCHCNFRAPRIVYLRTLRLCGGQAGAEGNTAAKEQAEAEAQAEAQRRLFQASAGAMSLQYCRDHGRNSLKIVTSDNIRRLLFPDLAFIGTASCLICNYNTHADVVSSLATSLQLNLPTMLTLPVECFTLTSVALGLLVTFKTQTGYQRFTEGRSLWGLLINESRAMASRVMARVPSPTGSMCPDVLEGKIYAVKLIRTFPVVLKAQTSDSELRKGTTAALRCELQQIWNPFDAKQKNFTDRLVEAETPAMQTLPFSGALGARTLAMYPVAGPILTVPVTLVPAAAKSFLSVLGFPLPEKQAHAELPSICRCAPFLSELKVDSLGRVIDISPQICDLGLTSIPWVSKKEVAVPNKTWKQVIREQKRRRTRMQENETAMIQRLKKRVRGKQRIDFV